MLEYFTLQRANAREILADGAQEKQEGKQRQWQQESPFKEVLEQVKRKCGYRLRSPDNAPCVHRNETWQLGEFYGRMQEGRKALLKEFGKLVRRWQLVSQCVNASPCRRNGVQHRRCEDFAKDVGRALLGRRLANAWPKGRGAFAYIFQPLE